MDATALGLLPFTAMMKPPVDVTPEAWVERCVETTRQASVDKETRGTLLFALSLFGSLVHPPELFQDPISEAIMQESPFYERVMQRGMEQGTREILIESILENLEVRFEVGDLRRVKASLQTIETSQQLRELRRAALQVPSLEAFRQTLDSNGNP